MLSVYTKGIRRDTCHGVSHLRDLPALMVAAYQKYPVWIPDLQPCQHSEPQ
jgi:hypothetical protein